MTLFSNDKYRTWFLIGLFLQIIAAWFSVGYHQPDEHFQILEFTNYKLGFSPASDLAWEYSAKCRSAVLPLIAYCISKMMLFFNGYNPALVAFLLRLLMGIISCLVTYRLVKQLLPEFTTDKGKAIFVWCSFLLWFVPYIGVRFSSENFSGLLFYIAISLLISKQQFSKSNSTVNTILAGLLLGFALFIRIQIVFAIFGLALWMLFIKKLPWKQWLLLSMFGVLAIGLCIIADYWLYNEWVLSPVNYFYVNIVKGVSAQYGVFPWWYYITLFLQIAVPPISIALLLFFIYGIQKKPFHLFSIICLCMLIGHFFIGHKEMRFLFPISFAFIFLACLGIDRWIKDHPQTHNYRWISNSFIVINVLILAFRLFTPAQEAIKYFNFIYSFSHHQPAILISIQKDPYKLNGVEVNFYKSKLLGLYIVQNYNEVSEILRRAKDSSVLYFSENITTSEFQKYKMERIYCLFPEWLLRFNINHWEERSNIWGIYKLTFY